MTNGCCSDFARSSEITSGTHPVLVSGNGHAAGAVFVKGGKTFVGTNDPVIPADGEGPERQILIKDFYLESEAVTVRRFADFVDATGYVTESERLGSSAVFVPLLNKADSSAGILPNTPWWARVDGANWRNPEGPHSSVDGRMDHPVTHVSWNDAVAFARWAGGRLATEVEWEHAARAGNNHSRYPWGNDEPSDEAIFCNIWQGSFPDNNTMQDGSFGTAPARSFTPSRNGFYNLAGNVWEWTSEPFKVRSLSRSARGRNGQAQKFSEKVLKGGSFLCHKSYCYRYRIAARMGLSPDSASSNAGFRVAYDNLPNAGKLGQTLG